MSDRWTAAGCVPDPWMTQRDGGAAAVGGAVPLRKDSHSTQPDDERQGPSGDRRGAVQAMPAANTSAPRIAGPRCTTSR